MEEIIVLGDVHGLRIWEEIVARHPGSKFVFLGDYNDPYGCAISNEEVLENFKRLIDFKLAHEEEVVLLLGNHDMHYKDLELAALGTRFNMDIALDLMRLFDDYSYCFQNAYQCGKLLFTHAGVSKEWFENIFQTTTKKEVAWLLNHCEDQQAEALHHCGASRGGDCPYGGIFWADKGEFAHPLEGFIQIVGHNRVDEIEEWKGENGERMFFCDSLHKGYYLIIHSSKDTVFRIGRIN